MGQFAGSMPGAFRSIIEVTPHSRLRHQIRDTLDLYERASRHTGLEQASADLAQTVEIQTSVLLTAVSRTGRRRWDWGEFTVGVALTIIVAIGFLVGFDHRAYWWGWVLLIVCGFLELPVLSMTVQAPFGR